MQERYVQVGVCRKVCAETHLVCAQGPVQMENVLTSSVTDLDCLFHVSAALYTCMRHGEGFLTSRRC